MYIIIYLSKLRLISGDVMKSSLPITQNTVSKTIYLRFYTIYYIDIILYLSKHLADLRWRDEISFAPKHISVHVVSLQIVRNRPTITSSVKLQYIYVI